MSGNDSRAVWTQRVSGEVTTSDADRCASIAGGVRDRASHCCAPNPVSLAS